ncbi:hypothetical protein FSP39_021374 [Pinctada imbricata]|uniref:QRICH1-like domain-containing protein n=1 Tax=Pinctada imbricata TaxID=66713 RepID=A0AA88YL35_PINIB|nr:hypothetical protein FSP39_021374 [Pinctada imbricata]
MDGGNAERKMETGCIATGIENFDFLDCEIDDISLYQVCAEMKNEFAVYEGFQDLTLSQTLEQYGHFDVALPLDPTEGENTRKAISDDDLCDTKRFGVAVCDQDLQTLIESKENANTKSNTKWAVNVFEKWRETRGDVPELHTMDSKSMDYNLQRFIVEARKKDGSLYPPKSLYLIACGLLRCLRSNEVFDKNFLDDKNTDFVKFRKVMDAQMKTLLDQGLGCTVKQADPITLEDEETLLEKNVFGMDNGDQLQRTIFFYASKLFGLRGCDEHHDLRCEQFSIGTDGDGKWIQFVGRSTKTYKGGLGQMNVTNKNIKHHCQPGDRCIADYFSLYLDSLGNEGSFYRRPLPGSSESPIRYGNQVVCINKLKVFMKTICSLGGLKGNFTNHSGKRTCATQWYTSGIEEQEIMSRAGHRSIVGVRKYKRPSSEMLKSVSAVLDPPIKKVKSEAKIEPMLNDMPMDQSELKVAAVGAPPPLASEPNNILDPRLSLRDIGNSVFQNCTFNFAK